MSASWTLRGPDGATYQSDRPGTLGGHRRSKLYGRLDCRSALQALARGGYARDRVFFIDEHAAQAAGYRPCAVCLPDQYAAWKTARPLPALTDDLPDDPWAPSPSTHANMRSYDFGWQRRDAPPTRPREPADERQSDPRDRL